MRWLLDMDAATIILDGRRADRRYKRAAVHAARVAFRILDRAAPALAARVASRLWCSMKNRLAHRFRFNWDDLGVARAASAIAVPPARSSSTTETIPKLRGT